MKQFSIIQKKRIILLLITAFVFVLIGISLLNFQPHTSIDPYKETSLTLLRSYGWKQAAEQNETVYHTTLSGTAYVSNLVHLFPGPCNLSGIPLDLQQYYPSLGMISPDHTDLRVDWYRFDVQNPYSDKVQLTADLIYYDGILGVARVAVSGYTPEPEVYPEDFPGKLRFSWPLDIDQSVFQQEVLALADALYQ